MSRVGKKFLSIPKGVSCDVQGQTVSAKGPQGNLSMTLPEGMSVLLKDNQIFIEPTGEVSVAVRSLWGTNRNLVRNVLQGVCEGFKIDLEIVGVGYRASLQGTTLLLKLGFSHDVLFPIPDGIKIAVEKPTALSIFGIDRQMVGQVASKIYALKPPEPYKGKGIRYKNQIVLKKSGKKK